MGILSKLLTFSIGYCYGIYEVYTVTYYEKNNHWYRGPYDYLMTKIIRNVHGDAGLPLAAVILGSFLVVPPIYGLLTQYTLRKTGLYLMKKL